MKTLFQAIKECMDEQHPAYMIDIQIKNFDQYYYQCTLEENHALQALVKKALYASSFPFPYINFPAIDRIQCIIITDQEEVLLKHLEEIDDAIHQIPDPRLYQKLFLGIGIYKIKEQDDIFTCARCAEMARASSKDAHKLHTHIEWYHDHFIQSLVQKRTMEQQMYHAIGTHQFQMVIQPKIRCTDECVAGGEALIRLPYADGMDIDTFHMITLAESNGMIQDIDLYMFKQVCEFQQDTLKKQLPLKPISVNVSRIHFQNPDFFQTYLEIFQQYSLPADCIELEITESATYEQKDTLPQIIHAFQTAGFRVALDDFGSGQSSLGMLSTLSINTIKLDRSFFLQETEQSRMIVDMILHLAHNLHIESVAEGIEKKEQVRFLMEHGCNLIQGFYYAKPMTPKQFRAFGL